MCNPLSLTGMIVCVCWYYVHSFSAQLNFFGFFLRLASMVVLDIQLFFDIILNHSKNVFCSLFILQKEGPVVYDGSIADKLIDQ